MKPQTITFLKAVAVGLGGILTAFTIWVSSFEKPAKPTPSPKPVPTPTLPPLASLAKYNEQMLTKGRVQLGNRDAVLAASMWEGNAWYYDGTRVAYQIADYTGDKSFAEYAKNPLDVYRPYVLDNSGNIPAWRHFAQGLRMHYERTKDEASKQALLLLVSKGYPSEGLKPELLLDQEMSRELAYALEVLLECEKAGQPRHSRLPVFADMAIGHIDQWCVKESAPCKPFMFALTAEALIQYHEATGDKRILPAIKVGADWIWAKAWVAADKAFVYEVTPGQPLGKGEPDLNLLIAPVYGWLYAQTGDKSYIDKGDQIFTGGVDGAWLDQGKQFNQSYRWSMDYLKWRGVR